MIQNIEELKKYLKEDRKNYINDGENIIKLILMGEIKLQTYRFVKQLRYTEYYHNQKGIISSIKYVLHRRKKNILGKKLGIEMSDGCFLEGLAIYHPNGIVVNGYSKIGKNCKLHGDNCIGNSGKSFASPVIGDNVRIGVGAKIIGDIEIADDVIIAAGAIVVDSFYEKGITVAGIPAKKVK